MASVDGGFPRYHCYTSTGGKVADILALGGALSSSGTYAALTFMGDFPAVPYMTLRFYGQDCGLLWERPEGDPSIWPRISDDGRRVMLVHMDVNEDNCDEDYCDGPSFILFYSSAGALEWRLGPHELRGGQDSIRFSPNGSFGALSVSVFEDGRMAKKFIFLDIDRKQIHVRAIDYAKHPKAGVVLHDDGTVQVAEMDVLDGEYFTTETILSVIYEHRFR